MARPKGEPLYPITLSIPVMAETKQRLAEEAEKRGVPLATHARWLLMKGVKQ